MYRGLARYLKALRSHATPLASGAGPLAASPPRRRPAPYPQRVPTMVVANELSAGFTHSAAPDIWQTTGSGDAGPPETGHLRGIEECVRIVRWRASYQDVLVLRVSGLVFGRESLPCTGLLKDLAD